MFHTVNLGSGRCNPTELDGFKAVNTEELDKVKPVEISTKLFVADTPLINELKKTYRPLNRKCQKSGQLPDSLS
jgi:hypothetical protein